MLGAIIGDTVGSVYEFNNVRTKDFPLLGAESSLTDDSIMTLAVAEILQKQKQDDRSAVVKTLKKWGRAYPDSGYGGSFYRWLFSDNENSYGSYGNGAAMRVSPCGWYGNSEEEVRETARKVTIVTHSHPEGLRGAEVTAMCVYYARIGRTKEQIKSFVSNYYDLNFNYETLKRSYRFNETCQGTVPQAVFCFLISSSFEDCIRTTVSIGGDCDTTSAISGAIAEAYYKDIDGKLINDVIRKFPEPRFGCNPKEIISNYLDYRK